MGNISHNSRMLYIIVTIHTHNIVYLLHVHCILWVLQILLELDALRNFVTCFTCCTCFAIFSPCSCLQCFTFFTFFTVFRRCISSIAMSDVQHVAFRLRSLPRTWPKTSWVRKWFTGWFFTTFSLFTSFTSFTPVHRPHDLHALHDLQLPSCPCIFERLRLLWDATRVMQVCMLLCWYVFSPHQHGWS